MKSIALVLLCGGALTLAGCATSSGQIASAYSSPLQYQSYNCQQLGYEDQALVSRVTSLGGQIDKRATNDKIAAGVGIVLFWPALFLIKGDSAASAEYARLKGEHESIQQIATMKGCLGGSLASGSRGAADYTPVVSPTMSYHEWMARYGSTASAPQPTPPAFQSDEGSATIVRAGPPNAN